MPLSFYMSMDQVSETEVAEKPAVQLSAEQMKAIDYVKQNISCGLIAISGPAGSGKTTLVRELVAKLEKKTQVTISAMTNKATYILRNKGIDAVTFHQACMKPIFKPPLDKLADFLDQYELEDKSKIDYPTTLVKQFGKEALEKSLETAAKSGIYSALRQLDIKDIFRYIAGWLPASRQIGILIIDEASMLGLTELKTAQQVFNKIILVGDENQLPPVKSEPVFWNVENRVLLKEIHRQAEGSQPLQMATAIRLGEKFDTGDVQSIDLGLCRAGMPVIVWRNKTRVNLTQAIREKLGYKDLGPQPGEVLICRNSSDRRAKMRGLINNSLWTVAEADGFTCTLRNDQGEILEQEQVHIEELEKGDGSPFRFAYAISGHSSQGSQWPEVQIHDLDMKAFFGFNREDARKWLYTAVTRAVSRVVFVSSKVE